MADLFQMPVILVGFRLVLSGGNARQDGKDGITVFPKQRKIGWWLNTNQWGKFKEPYNDDNKKQKQLWDNFFSRL
jgi:hypothetical protein